MCIVYLKILAGQLMHFSAVVNKDRIDMGIHVPLEINLQLQRR